MAEMANSPLSGIKVVEITNIYSGPMAGMMLAELGADVVKVEGPEGPDPIRASGMGAGPDSVNSIFYSLNRGKRFCAIHAKTDEGRRVLTQLAASADVFLHNIRPGKPEEIGVGYEELAAINPGLIYVAISGVGNDGPEAHLPVYDYVMQAKIGMVDYQRDLNSGRSDLVHQVLVDKTSAMAAVQGVLAALYVREKTGLGQRIDVPMIAAGLSFLWPDGMAAAHAELEPALPLESLPPWLESAPGSFLVVLPTADGEIATGLLLPPWDGLCLALERADWVTDERFAEPLSRILNLPQLIEEVSGEVVKYSTAEVLERFANFDFAAGAVASRRDVHNDETIKHLGLISEHQAEHIGPVRQPGAMWTFSGNETVITNSIGFTGAQTRDVLSEIGMTEAEIEQLLADGIARIAEDGGAAV
ncbi:MAG: CaiB/BaiF CoA transferase family protein [Acidimicrobiales bacterium]